MATPSTPHHVELHAQDLYDTSSKHANAQQATQLATDASRNAFYQYVTHGMLLPKFAPLQYKLRHAYKIVICNLCVCFALAVAMVFFIAWFNTWGNVAKLTAMNYNPLEAEYNADSNADMTCLYGSPLKIQQVLNCSDLLRNVSQAINETGMYYELDITVPSFIRGTQAYRELALITCQSSSFPTYVLQKRIEYEVQFVEKFMVPMYASATGSTIALQWMIQSNSIPNATRFAMETNFFVDFVVPEANRRIALVITSASRACYSSYFTLFAPRTCQRYQRDEVIKIVTNIVNSFFSAKTVVFAMASIALGIVAK